MKNQIKEEAVALLAKFDPENETSGVLVAILSDSETLSVSAHTSNNMVTSLIGILCQQLLAQNVCCKEHYFKCLQGLSEVMAQAGVQAMAEASDTESVH